MANTAVRFEKEDNPYDGFNQDAKWVNFGVLSETAKWTSNVNNRSGVFGHNSYVANGQADLVMQFDSSFTISFWAKFPAGGLGVSDLTDNKFFIILDDGYTLDYTIPNTDLDNLWHHYSIVRTGNNDITMRIDGVTVATGNSDELFDLLGASYFGLGNYMRHYTGYDVVADDIVIVRGALWKTDFPTSLPLDYLDLGNFRQYLYIVVSTGEVWGYAQGS